MCAKKTKPVDPKESIATEVEGSEATNDMTSDESTEVESPLSHQYNPLSVVDGVYLRPREPDEVCLVGAVIEHLRESIGTEAAVHFGTNTIIDDVIDKNQDVQRFIINRYFNNLLLTFRDKVDVSIVETSMMLVNDGDSSDWISLFSSYVLPFLKEHNVFDVVYNKLLYETPKG